VEIYADQFDLKIKKIYAPWLGGLGMHQRVFYGVYRMLVPPMPNIYGSHANYIAVIARENMTHVTHNWFYFTDLADSLQDG